MVATLMETRAATLRGATLRAIGAPGEGMYHELPTITVMIGTDLAAVAADVDIDPDDWRTTVRFLAEAGYTSLPEPAWDSQNGLWAWLLDRQV